MTTTLATTHQKKELHQFLERMGPEIGKVVSSFMTPEAMAALVYTEAARVPAIFDCLKQNPGSVASTIMLASQLGLNVSGPLGHFYLIPRFMKIDPRDKSKNAPKAMTLTYIIGYKGFLELARRSDDIERPNSGVIYKDELPGNGGAFHWKDEPPECDHPHHWGLKRKDAAVVGAYALVDLVGGFRIQVLLDRDAINARRKRAQTDTFWRSDFVAMARKSAIRALMNGGEVPLTPALAAAVQADLQNDRRDVIDADDIPRLPVIDPLRNALGMDEPPAQPEPEAEPEEVDVDVDALPLLDAIGFLEGKLDEELREEAEKASGVNLEAEFEGQGKAPEKYRAELKKRVDALAKS